MENIFVRALVTAGSCREHSTSKPVQADGSVYPPRIRSIRVRVSTSLGIHGQTIHTSTDNNAAHCKPMRTTSVPPYQYIRGKISESWVDYRPSPSTSTTDCIDSRLLPQDLSRSDYMGMLDYYREAYHTEPPIQQIGLEAHSLPTIEASEQEVSKTTVKDLGDTSESSAVQEVIRVIMDENSTHQQLYESYRNLPFPGILYLPETCRRAFLRRMSVMQKKTEAGALRYLSIVDDMKAADLPLTQAEWSSAIHLAGRCFSTVSALEVEAALRVWKEMEQEASVEGTNVTFNILFDIAVKAGKFPLAEMILEEMKARKLYMSRFAQVGMIYYHGLRGDGDGVRRAYRNLVDAGHIVDTTVLNCVIASLLRADELAPAEQVYERMKIMYARWTGSKLPPNDWKGKRELGKVLDRADRVLKSPIKKQQLQNMQSLSPDRHTYVLLLSHQVSRGGELQRVASLLDDMQSMGLAVTGKFFLEIFRGFANHGGVRYSSWTQARLESVWKALQQALADQLEDVSVEKWMAIWAVRAFARCYGRDRTLEIWDELKSRWRPTYEEENMMSGILDKALKDAAREDLR